LDGETPKSPSCRVVVGLVKLREIRLDKNFRSCMKLKVTKIGISKKKELPI
jgi:hypothetical protein